LANLRLFFIHKGKIIASGSLTEMRRLLGRDDTVYIQADRLPEKTLMENFNIEQIEILSKKNGYMEGVLRVAPDRIPDLLRELVSQGISIYGCIPRQASLETIFDKILGHQEMGQFAWLGIIRIIDGLKAAIKKKIILIHCSLLYCLLHRFDHKKHTSALGVYQSLAKNFHFSQTRLPDRHKL
jgi:hypothetical protein